MANNYYELRKRAVGVIEHLYSEGTSPEKIKLVVARKFGLGALIVDRHLNLLKKTEGETNEKDKEYEEYEI